MQDPFDPYWQWLAIPPGEQRPDHYRLLGLRQFETDRGRIAGAVQSRVDHIRACDDGSRPDLVKRVLEHVAAARDTLLSPVLKAQYDNLLLHKQAGQGGQAPQGTTRPPAASEGSPAPSPVSAPPANGWTAPSPAQAPPRSDHQPIAPAVSIVADPGERNRKARSAPSPTWLFLFGVAATLVLVLGWILWFSAGDQPRRARSEEPARARSAETTAPRQPADRAHRQQAAAPQPARKPPGGDRSERTSPPSLEPMMARRPRGPETMADLMLQADDTALDTATVTGKLAAARQAMWSRDLAMARRHVDAAIQAARTPTEQAEVQRVGKLLQSLEAFWAAVRQAAGRLESGEELRVGEALVMVVEAGAGQLTVRAAGQNRTYRLEELPQKLAVALAEQALPKGQPAADLHVGSFLAIDLRGDRHDAQTRWERAGAEGKALLIELTLTPPVETAESAEPRSPVLPSGVP